jgi:hypothetical protein
MFSLHTHPETLSVVADSACGALKKLGFVMNATMSTVPIVATASTARSWWVKNVFMKNN